MHWFVRPQTDFLYDQSGRLLVDQVIRFESLEECFNQVFKQLGLSGGKLPHMNYSMHGTEKESLPYQAYYKLETRLWVKELYRSDIEKFGYCFE